MSRFDEEPDGDPHGECAAEIQSLKYQLTNYRIAHERQAAAITRLEAENAKARELLEAVRACGVKYGELQSDIAAFLAKGDTP